MFVLGNDCAIKGRKRYRNSRSTNTNFNAGCGSWRCRRHFRVIFFNESFCILIKFSLKYVRKGSFDNKPTFVQIMAWRQSGDKPLSDPMVISLPTHMCVTRPQWVNGRIGVHACRTRALMNASLAFWATLYGNSSQLWAESALMLVSNII